jgi:hypothetical protein
MQALPIGPIPLSIQLPDVTQPQLLLAEVQYVGQVTTAIIAEFKLDAAPQQVQQYMLGDDGSRTPPLDPRKTTGEAGIHAGTKLVVELMTTGPAVKGVCVCAHCDVEVE